MAVKVWLLGGVAVNDNIVDPVESCWKRPDLVNVPDILKYTEDKYENDRIRLYKNNIGIVIVMIRYADFENIDDMNADYYEEKTDSTYSQCYDSAITLINQKNFANKIVDLDWVIPVLEGEFDVQESICTIPHIGEDCKEYVSLIDNSFIYTSIRHISDFVHYICNRKKLTKYQRWQLAYYQMAVQTIESPKVFLTNKDEIEMSIRFYDCWQINDNIRAVINNTNQAVTLFTFLSNCEENDEDDLFSSFLTFFGIVVGLEAIYNLFLALFNDLNQWFKIVFVTLIAITVLIFGCIFVQKVFKKTMENREFKRKTKR